MFSLIKSSYSEDHPNKHSTLKFILFVFITGMTALFTLGRFEVSQNNTAAEMPFLSHFHYYPGLTPVLSFTLVLSLIYIVLTLLLFYLVRKEIKYHPLIISIYLFFIFLRAISIFSFSYTQKEFIFSSILNEGIIVLPFEGFPLKDRFSTFLNDFCFYSYFFTLYYTIKPVMKHNKSLFHGLYALIQLAVLSMVVYSVLFQFDLIVLSFKTLFLHSDSFYPFYGFSSYLSHRNVFGFFLFVASLMNINEFLEKPKISFLILNLIYLFFLVLIVSKTPLLLLLISYLFGFGILYPVLFFKKHKGYSIAFSILFFAIVLFLLISYLFFKESIFERYILNFFRGVTDWTTMDSRRDLGQCALSMLDSNTFWLGYNRYPFISLFSKLIPYYPCFDQVVTYTSHNSYIDILMYNGVFGLVLTFFVIALYEKKLFDDFLVFKRKEAIFYYLQTIVLFFYSYSEPRFIFLEEGTFLFFVLLIIAPFVSEKEKSRKEILIENLL